MCEVCVDGENLSIEDVIKVARCNAKVSIAEHARRRVLRSRKVLEKLVSEGRVIYGVNTGFGALSGVKITSEENRELQSNLIRSHASGVGDSLDSEVVRALMLLRVNTLAKGYSGIRLETLETLTEMLNREVHPTVPAKGSVGASGDLAPLSHMILVLMGEGQAEYKGKVMRGAEALLKVGIRPIQLEPKEGIALNNGTQLMTAIAALNLHDSEKLMKTAEIAAALVIEALMGNIDAFDELIHKVRPHTGQAATAQSIRRLLSRSRLVKTSSESPDEERSYPHDPYSLRCAPQVLGAVRDAIEYVKGVVEIELNSATDNPIVFGESEKCLSGGNFHGQPISLAMDMLGIALTIIGNMSERRTARLLDEKLNKGLPSFLVSTEMKKGLHSGLMTVQYTAAALASENKVLAHPACVDSIPTSANFEDFVSMGAAAAQKTTQILRNAEYIVAIELLSAAQAIEFRGAEKLGEGTKAAFSTLRHRVPKLKEDRVLGKDIEEVRKMIREGIILEKVEKMCGNKQ